MLNEENEQERRRVPPEMRLPKRQVDEDPSRPKDANGFIDLFGAVVKNLGRRVPDVAFDSHHGIHCAYTRED